MNSESRDELLNRTVFLLLRSGIILDFKRTPARIATDAERVLVRLYLPGVP